MVQKVEFVLTLMGVIVTSVDVSAVAVLMRDGDGDATVLHRWKGDVGGVHEAKDGVLASSRGRATGRKARHDGLSPTRLPCLSDRTTIGSDSLGSILFMDPFLW